MLRILLFTLCSSVFFSACGTDSVANTDETSSAAGNGGNSSDSNSGLGSNLALPGNTNKSAITARYNAYIDTYYATYQDDLADGTLDPSKAKAGEDAARIKWVSGSADNIKRTVSEGIGYGMLLTALNDDFARFDKL